MPEAAVEAAMHEVPIDLAKATIVAPCIDDGSAGWTTPGRIPDAAVEGARSIRRKPAWLKGMSELHWQAYASRGAKLIHKGGKP